jgi:hypothetical protein
VPRAELALEDLPGAGDGQRIGDLDRAGAACSWRCAPEELGRSIRTAIARMFGPELATRPGYHDLVAVQLTSMRGVALTYTFERRDHRRDPNLAVWKRLARVYLGDGVTAPVQDRDRDRRSG